MSDSFCRSQGRADPFTGSWLLVVLLLGACATTPAYRPEASMRPAASVCSGTITLTPDQKELLWPVASDREPGNLQSGLAGAWYRSPNLTRIADPVTLDELERTWYADSHGYGNDWSIRWTGYLVAPTDGPVAFHGRSNKGLMVEVAGRRVIELFHGGGLSGATLDMVRGQRYPVHVVYLQQDAAPTGSFSVAWSWGEREPEVIAGEALRFTAEQGWYWGVIDWLTPAHFELAARTRSQVPAEHAYAYREAGRFAGWPANHGMWAWSDEILVGFRQGYYNSAPGTSHAIRRDLPQGDVLARSLDGGYNWTIEPFTLSLDDAEPRDCPALDFTHPGFAMRVDENVFAYSLDKGASWMGPCRINGLGFDPESLTSRTDYIVKSADEILAFMSARTGMVHAGHQDRAFAARSTDGGRSFEFLGWMTHDLRARSVMPSTVYVGENHLVSVMRRRQDPLDSHGPLRKSSNWIEAAESRDDGVTWTSLGKVADTDRGEKNGSPPALVRRDDGSLVVVYGYRSVPAGIRARVSTDQGRTWSATQVLRADGSTWDIGYPRMVVRADGKLVTAYYFTTQEHPYQHIGVTIWEPMDEEP